MTNPWADPTSGRADQPSNDPLASSPMPAPPPYPAPAAPDFGGVPPLDPRPAAPEPPTAPGGGVIAPAPFPSSAPPYPPSAPPYPPSAPPYPPAAAPYPVSGPVSGYGTYAGYGSQPGYAPQYLPTQRQNGLAVASMVVSIVGVVLLFCYGGGAILGAIGAILGHVSKRQIRERGEAGGGMATAGIVVGWIAAALGVIIIGLIVAFLATALSTTNNPSDFDYSEFEDMIRLAFAG